jgi:hypothetical protein
VSTPVTHAEFVKLNGNRKRTKAREHAKLVADLLGPAPEPVSHDTPAPTDRGPRLSVPKARLEALRQFADQLRALDKNDVVSVIEKGRILQAAFDIGEHGNHAGYQSWIDEELGWSPRTVARYRGVYEFSQICQNGKFGEQIKIADLNISKSAVYLLADEIEDAEAYWQGECNTAAIKEVLELARTSRVMPAQAKAIFNKHAPEPEPDVETGDDAADETGDDAADDEAAALASLRDGFDDGPLPEPNELSQALEIVLAHDLFSNSAEWKVAARLIGAVGFTGIRDALGIVSLTYFGDDALKKKADRAQAQSDRKLRKSRGKIIIGR